MTNVSREPCICGRQQIYVSHLLPAASCAQGAPVPPSLIIKESQELNCLNMYYNLKLSKDVVSLSPLHFLFLLQRALLFCGLLSIYPRLLQKIVTAVISYFVLTSVGNMNQNNPCQCSLTLQVLQILQIMCRNNYIIASEQMKCQMQEGHPLLVHITMTCIKLFILFTKKPNGCCYLKGNISKSLSSYLPVLLTIK